MSELMPKSVPALVFVKDLSTWFIVNNKGKPIMWMNDRRELIWFFCSHFGMRCKRAETISRKESLN